MFNITVHGLSELRGRMSTLARNLRGMVTQAIEEYAASHGVAIAGGESAAKPAMAELPYGKASTAQKPGRYAMSKGAAEPYAVGGEAKQYAFGGGSLQPQPVAQDWVRAAVKWAEEKIRQFLEGGR